MSNHTNDPWETEMSRTFDQRVRDLNEAPLNLDQVKGKAVRIRRNRRHRCRRRGARRRRGDRPGRSRRRRQPHQQQLAAGRQPE